MGLAHDVLSREERDFRSTRKTPVESDEAHQVISLAQYSYSSSLV